jgi:hypothetical protein
MSKYSELADSYYRLPDEVSAALRELEAKTMSLEKGWSDCSQCAAGLQAERDRLREALQAMLLDSGAAYCTSDLDSPAERLARAALEGK